MLGKHKSVKKTSPGETTQASLHDREHFLMFIYIKKYRLNGYALILTQLQWAKLACRPKSFIFINTVVALQQQTILTILKYVGSYVEGTSFIDIKSQGSFLKSTGHLIWMKFWLARATNIVLNVVS